MPIIILKDSIELSSVIRPTPPMVQLLSCQLGFVSVVCLTGVGPLMKVERYGQFIMYTFIFI